MWHEARANYNQTIREIPVYDVRRVQLADSTGNLSTVAVERRGRDEKK